MCAGSPPPPDDLIHIVFRPSGVEAAVSSRALRESIVRFLGRYCGPPLVEPEFCALLDGANGEARLEQLAALAGYAGATGGFLAELTRRLALASNGEDARVEVGGVALPYHLLMAAMEAILPGVGFMPIKEVAELDALANTRVEDREAMQRVLDRYPVRLSWHALRQMRLSRAVAHQYYPFAGELDSEGETHTWVGQFQRGVVEQMYPNRVIFMMNMACPVYCRFCFRKHKECRTQPTPTVEQVDEGVACVSQRPDVKEVLITGGDPFMNMATLGRAMEGLARLPHVRTLRLASRALSYFPELFRRGETSRLKYLLSTNRGLQERGKRLEVATHFVHPDELSWQALELISELVGGGIPVYVQTPYVRGCNETGQALIPLFNDLRAAGAELHYIFMPTSPIQGNRVYWASIDRGLEAARLLRAGLSDRAMPHITTATPVGKIDWGNSGWAVERSAGDPERVWIRTPFSEAFFRPFASGLSLGPHVRCNGEGTLEAAFRCDIGDEALFTGPRPGVAARPEAAPEPADAVAALADLDPRTLDAHIGRRPVPCLARDHLARAELDVGASAGELEAALAYLREQPLITDLVLSRREDPLTHISHTLEVLDRLAAVPSLRVLRVRSPSLGHGGSAEVLDGLARRNRLRAVRPRRIEVEVRILLASSVTETMGRVVQELRQRGIAVYANVPLLAGVNDTGAELRQICFACREHGVEVCNVYVAGLPGQAERPVDLDAVIDLAGQVRRDGSGREVPRYLVRTMLGEVDFSITPRIFQRDPDGRVWVTLRPHDLEHFRRMDPEFAWPEGTRVDADGHPAVPLPGARLARGSFLVGP